MGDTLTDIGHSDWETCCHHLVDCQVATAKELLITDNTAPPTSQPSDTVPVEAGVGGDVEESLRGRAAAFTRIREQYQVAVKRQQFHFGIMSLFFTNYYTTVTLASISAIVAAIALVSISKKGWQNSHALIITAFVLSAASTAYFGALPSVFRQEQNVSDNKALFVEYSGITNEIRTYCATGEDITGKSVMPSQFAHAIDLRLGRLMQIPLGFDLSKVPTYTKIEGDILAAQRQDANEIGDRGRAESRAWAEHPASASGSGPPSTSAAAAVPPSPATAPVPGPRRTN